MKNIVIIQEFGTRLAVAKKTIVVREQDIESSLGQFDLKSFRNFTSFEKFLEKESICILSNERVYDKLLKSLSV